MSNKKKSNFELRFKNKTSTMTKAGISGINLSTSSPIDKPIKIK